MALQQTIENTVSLQGIGLHTAQMAEVTLKPAPENYGIKFVRSDIQGSEEIEADIDNVVDLSRGTAIGKKGVTVYSVEHLMSALCGLQIDNCRIEVNCSEVPLMDGSAQPFVELIRKAGIVQQSATREVIKIEEPIIHYMKEDIAFGLLPSDDFRVTMLIDYKHPALGAQHSTLVSLADYEKDFAPARTFCFLSEIEKLREQGLIKGGKLDSAVVVQDIELTSEHIEYIRRLFNEKGRIFEGQNGFLNNVKLRFYNELCRHKVVDLLGDFYLLGKPLLCHIQAARTGHAANIEMARKIREYVNKNKRSKAQSESTALDIKQIMELLPHRYPFLFVDKVVEFEPRRRIVAIKNVTINEPFFQGHFPEDPIMPGVLQIEAMAQAGGILGLYDKKKDIIGSIAFLAIDKARFRYPVRPGDVLRIEVETLQDRRSTMRFSGKCYVGDRLVSEAELMAMMGKRGDAK